MEHEPTPTSPNAEHNVEPEAEKKQQVLAQLKQLSREHKISREEVLAALENYQDKQDEHAAMSASIYPTPAATTLPAQPVPSTSVEDKAHTTPSDSHHISASQALFYIGGLVMFGSIAYILSNSWSVLGSAQRILISLGSGVLLWVFAYLLLRSSSQNEQREGLGDALLLTGSLASLSGTFNTLGEIGLVDATSAVWSAFIGFSVLGSVHYGLDRLVRRVFTNVFTVLMGLASYYALVQAVFGELVQSFEFYGYTSIIGGLLLILVGRLYMHGAEDRRYLKDSWWGLGGFIILSSAFGLAFSGGAHELIWQILFPLGLYLAFMISVKYHSKNFLASGSFFLFIYTIAVSFKYFGSGLGAAVALLIASIAIIASAMVITSIRKKYFPA